LRPFLVLLALALALALAAPALAAEDPPQQFAAIGDLPLVSGETLRDARIGYRVAGPLNAERSNVIVFPTWFTGTTGELLAFGPVGPGRVADTDRYHVILVDALGNGVSTSPSNSAQQPGADFPAIAIDDMVNATHALLRELGFDHVRAVMGVSMGGMQTFQWLAQYPDFMDKAIPIDGTPKQTSYDTLLWRTHADAIETLLAAGVDNARTMRLLNSFTLLNLYTPEYFIENVAPDALAGFVADSAAAAERKQAIDYLAQARALLAHDVYADYADTGTPYTERVRAEVLVVGSASDLMVNPAPARELAAALGARYAEVRSDCGHVGSGCEAWSVAAMVAAFLE